MKKILISTLLLLAASTTQIKSHFTRGAIYNNKKTGQFIILVGDQHAVGNDESAEALVNGSQKDFFAETKEQRAKLIEEIIKIDKKSSLVLVESGENSDIHNKNIRCQKAEKFVNECLAKFGIDNQNFSPIYFLRPDLLKKNVNVLDVDPRYMEDIFEQEMPCLINAKTNGKETEQQIFIEDIINEIKQNIANLKKQAQEIQLYKNNYTEKEYKIIEDYFNNSIEYIEKNFSKYLKFLKMCKSLIAIDGPLDLSNVINLFDGFRKMKQVNTYHEFVFFDANLLHEILKNSDKKIIIICAGGLHTSRIEHLISDLGYDLFKEVGMINITKEACYNKEKLNQELSWIIKKKPDFINMQELFQSINTYKLKELLKQFNKTLIYKEKATKKAQKFLSTIKIQGPCKITTKQFCTTNKESLLSGNVRIFNPEKEFAVTAQKNFMDEQEGAFLTSKRFCTQKTNH